jgi:ketopantoate reductase
MDESRVRLPLGPPIFQKSSSVSLFAPDKAIFSKTEYFMKKKKIAVIGVGGRTGTMFAFELQKVAEVLGIGKEIKKISQKKFFVQRGEKSPQLFKERVIPSSQWPPDDPFPEIIFLTTKNPVGKIIKYYYQKIKEKKGFLSLPTLVLSQNGILAGRDALRALREIFGPASKKIRIVRISLFNPIDKRERNNKSYIVYSLPIRLAFAKLSGPGSLKDLNSVFKKAGFEAKEFSQERVKDMEISKLFLNLIGMASASNALSIKEGFQKKETFKKEIGALKEYVKVVRASRGKFLNFSHCPVKLLAFLIDILPIKVLLPFRNHLAKVVTQGRKGKPKDLIEIEYYNGAVVRLGKKTRTPTPINQKIIQKSSE